jgi:hypothetical protein
MVLGLCPGIIPIGVLRAIGTYSFSSHVKRIKNMGQYAWNNHIKLFHQRLSIYSNSLSKLFNVKDPKNNFNFER